MAIVFITKTVAPFVLLIRLDFAECNTVLLFFYCQRGHSFARCNHVFA